VVPGPNLATQPVPAMNQNQECVPLLDIRHFYVVGEYNVLWFKAAHTPILVTFFNPINAGRNPGALGDPSTFPTFGSHPIDTKDHSGARALAGYWFDDDKTFGMELGYFFAGQRQRTYVEGSDGGPDSLSLAVPFFNATTHQPSSDIIAVGSVNGVAGGVVDSLATRLSGAEANFTAVPHLFETDGFRVMFFGGFRYIALDEELNLAAQNGQIGPTELVYRTTDNFATRNRFYGGHLGVDCEFRNGPWILDFRGKFAVGDNHEVAHIDGNSAASNNTGPLSLAPGGLLTGPGNIGRFNQDSVAVAPEGTVTVGYQISHGIIASVSYNYLYISRVLRPGDIVDSQINPATLTPHPGFVFRETSFWAQGVSTGIEFRF
jgi:hypothetical protein